MTITAKYPSKCATCGGRIHPGDRIDWVKGRREVSHADPRDCEKANEFVAVEMERLAQEQRKAQRVETPKAPKAPETTETTEPTYKLHGGSGYGYRGWQAGQVLRNSERNITAGQPEYITVIKATKQYYSDDGLSFGVGDDQGYIYSATCRAATTAEAAPVIEAREAATKKRDAAKTLRAVAGEIRIQGERPAGQHSPEGEEIIVTERTIYGGGEWLVIGTEHIWYVQNNGADGDAWDANNVITGGAGAIGWRVAYDEVLAARIRAAAVAC